MTETNSAQNTEYSNFDALIPDAEDAANTTCNARRRIINVLETIKDNPNQLLYLFTNFVGKRITHEAAGGQIIAYISFQELIEEVFSKITDPINFQNELMETVFIQGNEAYLTNTEISPNNDDYNTYAITNIISAFRSSKFLCQWVTFIFYPILLQVLETKGYTYRTIIREKGRWKDLPIDLEIRWKLSNETFC